MKRKRVRYTKDMPHRLYTFFLFYNDQGAPSFGKFARSIGVTLTEVEGWRRYPVFDRAYRECNEIRRDYLIDNALTKRFDSSLTKFLLSSEYRMGEDTGGEDKNIEISLEVIER